MQSILLTFLAKGQHPECTGLSQKTDMIALSRSMSNVKETTRKSWMPSSFGKMQKLLSSMRLPTTTSSTLSSSSMSPGDVFIMTCSV